MGEQRRILERSMKSNLSFPAGKRSAVEPSLQTRRQKPCGPIHSTSLHFSLQQSTEEIEAITVTLQLPDLTSWSILPPQLFGFEQSPVGCYALYLSSDSSLRFESHDLVCVEPVLVVCFFQFTIEAGPEKSFVDGFESS